MRKIRIGDILPKNNDVFVVNHNFMDSSDFLTYYGLNENSEVLTDDRGGFWLNSGENIAVLIKNPLLDHEAFLKEFFSG